MAFWHARDIIVVHITHVVGLSLCSMLPHSVWYTISTKAGELKDGESSKCPMSPKDLSM